MTARHGASGSRAGGVVRARRLVLPAVLALLVLATAGALAPGPVAAASGDLTLVTDAVYTVQPQHGRVAVAVSIEAANHTRESRTRRFYFDHAFLAVQPGATDVRLSGPGKARARVARRTRESTLLRLDFGTRLYSGKRSTFRLTFTLPGTGRDASPQVRVGSGLVTLPVWAYASNGAKGSTVTVRVPSGWDVLVESGDLRRRSGTSGSGTVLTSGPLDRPLAFFAFVTAQRPAVLTDRPVRLDAGGQPVDLVLQGWADDPGWSKRVEALYRRALPVLRSDIGLPWPMERLTVAETASRDPEASAAMFDPAEGRVEIAYWAGPDVVIHQVAHGWFNGSLLGERWANEGFATWYGLRAATRLDEEVEPPELTRQAKAARLPLNAWGGSTGVRTPADAYAYAASTRLAGELAERVGEAVLRQVWADAAGRIGAYQPAATGTSPSAAAVVPEPERVDAVPDWRSLLDLLEARSGEDLAPLWREVVVTPEQAPLLDARAEARRSYARTLALAGDWSLPRSIRDALRAWDFPSAEAAMADARTVLASRNAVEELAGREGVQLADGMQARFEAGDLGGASAIAAAQRSAILAIARAEASRTSADDPLRRLGMLGEHPERDLVEARADLARGDLQGSMEAVDRALRAWTAAQDEGRRRALLGLAVAASLLLLAFAVGTTVRRLRRADRAAGVRLQAHPLGRGAMPPDDGPTRG